MENQKTTKAKQKTLLQESAFLGWLRSQKKMILHSASKLAIRSLVVFGFLASCFQLGWGNKAPTFWLHSFSMWMAFPCLALGISLYGRYIQQVSSLFVLSRWVLVLPFAFWVGSFRYWVPFLWEALLFLAFIAVSVCFHVFFFKKKEEPAWKRILVDTSIVIAFATHLFLPRAFFASFVAFLPIVVLVVFYNFLLERDRLLRAKALVTGEASGWLKTAYRLFPSSTYLLFLLPSLLFAEALVFYAVYEPPLQQKVQIKDSLRKKNTRKALLEKDKILKPTLLEWIQYTITIKMKARHANPSVDSSSGGVEYLEFGKGITWTALLIRAFLLLFYAKRLLLIFIMLMDSTYGVKVHRIGELDGKKDSTAMLNEHRNILQRTIDSFPRAWAEILLRGIQGRHGFLDPIGAIVQGISWTKGVFLPHFFPSRLEHKPPIESIESRYLREEEIRLVGKMQDRQWALNAFIDLVYPPLSQTFRGTAARMSNTPVLGQWMRWFITQPEPAVQARIIVEISYVVERMILSGQDMDLLTDSETDVLTPEQLWELRNRVLRVLSLLLSSPYRNIRYASATAIQHIASLPRPLWEDDLIWEKTSQALQTALQKDFANQKEESSFSKQNQELETLQTPEDSEKTKRYPDPYAFWQSLSGQEEKHALFRALGQIGREDAVQILVTAFGKHSEDDKEIIDAIGLSGKGSGQKKTGFELATHFLKKQSFQTMPLDVQFQTIYSITRLAFPTPLFEVLQKAQPEFEKLQQYEQKINTAFQQLEQQILGSFSEKEQELFFTQLRENIRQFEKSSQQSLLILHDTFWTLLHYASNVYLSAYLAQEEIPLSPEFTDLLRKLSFEDLQGWEDFFTHLPVEVDPTSWTRDFHAFFEWLAQTDSSGKTQYQRFYLLHESLQKGLSLSHLEKDSFESFQMFLSEYLQAFSQTIQAFYPCLQVRPTVTLHFPESQEQWKITWIGEHPWIQKGNSSFDFIESSIRFDLEYRTYSPLSLQPVSEVLVQQDIYEPMLRQGHLPWMTWMAFSTQTGKKIQRVVLGEVENDSFWKREKESFSSEHWEKTLHLLEHKNEFKKLQGIDLNYLSRRSESSFRQVFSKSRLKEQDPLMISREIGKKFDHFVSTEGKVGEEIPFVFFVSGNAGVGKTTFMLRKARSCLRGMEENNKKFFVFFLDIGLIESQESLAQWFYHELQIHPDLPTESKANEPSLPLLFEKLNTLFSLQDSPMEIVLFVDSFHENPSIGLPFLVELLNLAGDCFSKFPWFKMVFSIRESFLFSQLSSPLLQPYTQQGQFLPEEKWFYREQGGIHGIFLPLTEFVDHPLDSPENELHLAFSKYYDHTDAMGRFRFRPLTPSPKALDRFSLTKTLLSRPTVMPILMEAYHGKELPHDVQLNRLLSDYLHLLLPEEILFLQKLTSRMLYGSNVPLLDSRKWVSDTLFEEKALLEENEFRDFVEDFKYGRRIYDDLRARGILIRRWRLPQSRSQEKSFPLRHVTFTSSQLFEYLIYRELWSQNVSFDEKALLRDFSFGEEVVPTEHFAEDPVGWLLQLSQKSLFFRPLEGALELFLLQLLEEGKTQAIADFIDRSHPSNAKNRSLLFRAFISFDPRKMTQNNGILDTLLKELSEKDLLLIQDLGRYLSTRRNLEDSENLFKQVLEHSSVIALLERYPFQVSELFLSRADNYRKILEQRVGTLNKKSSKEYQEGLLYYKKATEMIQQYSESKLLQAKALRFQALYEQNADMDSAISSLEQSWELLQQENTSPVLQIEMAWVRHLQASLARRKVETSSFAGEEKEELLQHAERWAQEALEKAKASHHIDRTELLAFAYDNLGRTVHHIASQKGLESKKEMLLLVVEYFQGSVSAKNSLNDFLGMAMSHSGIASTFMELAKLSDLESKQSLLYWEKAKEQLQQALFLNKEKLKNNFGIALSHKAFADLYLLRKDTKTEGLFSLTEALIYFGKINHHAMCMEVISLLVKEITTLPLQEIRKLLLHIIGELRKAQDLGEWVLKAFLNESKKALSERFPRFIGEWLSLFQDDEP